MAVERYQRLKRLGQGMMSVVWLARDTYTQELVALKVMHTIAEDDRRNQKAMERFQREIEIARGLQHRHILPIIDYGYTIHDEREVPFLVSPYIEEGSLGELVRINPPWLEWSLVQIADVIMQAADSLWYLHTRKPQIVHQDVKPGNFLLHPVYTPQRAVYLFLCDFGISRWLQAESGVASELLGTFAYIAPEQVERQVHRASDQYALAVMACYLLTGKLPLQAPTNELYAKAHLEDRPLLPGQLNTQRFRSPEIDAVLERALAKLPEQRYPTIYKFGEALQQAIVHYVNEHPEGESRRVDTKTTPVVRDESTSGSIKSSGSAASIVIDPPSTGDNRALDEPLPARPGKMNKSEEEREFTLLTLHSPARVKLPARPKALNWSPDGYCLACSCYGQPPLYISRDIGLRVLQVPHVLQVNGMGWSPDRRVLALNGQNEIYFWDIAQQTLLSLTIPLAARNVEAMDWSVGGRLALWVENQILIYSLTPNALAVSRPPLPFVLSMGNLRSGATGVLRWSPDGMLLAAGASNGTVMGWDSQSGGKPWQVAATGQKVNSLNWSPDGVLLVVALRDNRVLGWEMRAQRQVLAWEKLPTMPRVVSVSSTRRVVVASSEKRLLCGRPGETAPSSSVAGQLLAAWSPTGPELATLDEQQENVLVIWRE